MHSLALLALVASLTTRISASAIPSIQSPDPPVIVESLDPRVSASVISPTRSPSPLAIVKPWDPSTVPTGACGGAEGLRCSANNCCSSLNWCGLTDLHCGTGCQSAFGQCHGSSSNSTGTSDADCDPTDTADVTKASSDSDSTSTDTSDSVTEGSSTDTAYGAVTTSGSINEPTATTYSATEPDAEDCEEGINDGDDSDSDSESVIDNDSDSSSNDVTYGASHSGTSDAAVESTSCASNTDASKPTDVVLASDLSSPSSVATHEYMSPIKSSTHVYQQPSYSHASSPMAAPTASAADIGQQQSDSYSSLGAPTSSGVYGGTTLSRSTATGTSIGAPPYAAPIDTSPPTSTSGGQIGLANVSSSQPSQPAVSPNVSASQPLKPTGAPSIASQPTDSPGGIASTGTQCPAFVELHGDGQTSPSFNCESGTAWPEIERWMPFEKLWDMAAVVIANGACAWYHSGTVENSANETAMVKASIVKYGNMAGMSLTFLLSIMMQESRGCVRVVTTAQANRNPGLFQCFNGRATCEGTTGSNCDESMIDLMVREGIMGSGPCYDAPDDSCSKDGFGPGLLQNYRSAPASGGAQKYYQAARRYNGGTLSSITDFRAGVSGTNTYVGDITNRMLGRPPS